MRVRTSRETTKSRIVAFPWNFIINFEYAWNELELILQSFSRRNSFKQPPTIDCDPRIGELRCRCC